MHSKLAKNIAIIVILILSFTTLTGCATKGQTGAAVGAGTGALIGGLANMHGSWAATALLGAGIGAGVGYLIGNEEDKKDAQRRAQATENELRPFAGTAWQVVSVTPRPKNDPYRSVVSSFGTNGIVTTSKVLKSGKTETVTERYRVVGSTLIFNNNDYVVNARYAFEGSRLVLDLGDQSVVLQRVN